MSEKERMRKEQLRVWLLEEEKQMLLKGAEECGLSQADYIRQLIMAAGITGRHWTMDKEQGMQIIYEINKIGTNINQIAYNTNAKTFAAHADWEELRENYFKLLRLIGRFPFLDKEAQEEWQQQIFTLLPKQ